MSSRRDLVAELAASRHECASILGFPGYARYTHASALSRDPSGPARLLEKLRDGAWDQAVREREEMQRIVGGGGSIGHWCVVSGGVPPCLAEFCPGDGLLVC